MSADWPILMLGDVCQKITDGAHNSPKSVENGKPMASVKDLTRYGVDLSEARLIDPVEFEKLVKQGCQPEVGDVLIAKDGNSALDTVCTVDQQLDAVMLSSVAILRPDRNKLDADFLKYYFNSIQVIDYLKSNFISGAAIPRVVLKDFRRAEIKVPPLTIQKIISEKLRMLDDKIELNRQTNQTLEHIAQAIFKSWFVDFEPTHAKIAALEAGGSEDDALLAAMQAIAGSALFATDAADADAQTQLARLKAEHPEQYATLRATAELFPSAMQESELGETPEGWEAGSIGDVATARGGYAFKGSQFEEYGNPVVKIKNIVGDGTVKLTGTQCVDDAVAETAYRFQLNDGDLVMAMTGATVGKTGLVLTLGEKVLLNQRVTVFQSKYFGSKISWFLFCLFARKDIFDVVVGTAQGSAQPNISSSGIEAVPIVVPAYEVLEQYLSVTDGLFKFWLENNRQSENLSSLRDTLLPKLLSGEIDVSTLANNPEKQA